MSITYQVERWNDIVTEFEPFVEPHWQELALDQRDVPVAIDWASYEKFDDAEELHVVTVRDDETLIGYHISLVKPGLHYKTTLHAFVDLYYLKPEYRHDRTGLGMFQFAEMALRNIGVVKVIQGSKLHLFHDKLFIGLDYRPFEVLFSKVLIPKEDTQ